MEWWLQALKCVKDMLAMKVSDEVMFAAAFMLLRATTAITSQSCMVSRWC